MFLFICEPPGFWDEPKKVNVKITTVNDFDADGKPRQIVTVETIDPDKEKRKRNEKNGAILFIVFLCLVGAGLVVYSILHACGLV